MLNGMRILAAGTREAVELSAAVLAQAGAQVAFARAVTLEDATHDVIIVSSDTCTADEKSVIARLKATGETIVCDITAMGSQCAGESPAYSDAQIQAMSGLMDTTGFSHGEPVRIGMPFTEISAALYASAAIAAALRVRRICGLNQHIGVSLFGCAVSALTTFLPAAFAGDPAERVGNRHPSCAPWNAYKTRDGWIVICTSTEEQWRKIRSAAAMPSLDDARFSTLRERVRHVEELDSLLDAWTSTMTTAKCASLCEGIGVAAGPIVSVDGLALEPNFALRHEDAAARMTAGGIDSETYRHVSLFRESRLSGKPHAAANRRDGVYPNAGALAGVNVIEIGQYTTAPLVGKHLAALGADVVKIEAPEGEVSRTWSPSQHGTSYFFALNNTDKRTMALDLKDADDRAHLRTLLADADVLVENLRPGALARLGFDRHALAEINPRLIYCSISGFGIETAYPSRPAFDTVIQAMGGLMDLTRSDGEPVKVGASAADILGGQAALFAIVARLAARSGDEGKFIEIAMQDVAAWSALFAAGNRRPAGVTESDVIRLQTLMQDAAFRDHALSTATDPYGHSWPVVKLPYQLSQTPAHVRRVPGATQRPMHRAGGMGTPPHRGIFSTRRIF
ncbi:CoA transferase [Paraburkholderia sp. FT54]|uniref:CaiB/BaiF CoA-transferase family protein n=1 Tax=Paraburkholderia sp. FT54 TaxID=3074437 RepID=UPI0028776F6D|nr:CoA transferase [Paraburkholderia sp. FT54]WNC92567.1 CoA transferase [Paraburkholderia sp. FT54]